MSGLFYHLGRRLGQKTVPAIRKSQWLWHSLAGSEDDRIRAEQAFGRDLAAELRNHVAVDPNPETRAWLEDIGQRLAGCVKNKLHRFHFESLDDESLNAMALPGGFIFVSRSLVELCQRDADEVAFVLGHEMAHVIRGHAANRLVRETTLNLASRVTRAGGPLSAWLRSTGLQLLASAHSRDGEFEADDLGSRLANGGGYPPQGAVRLLRRLETLREREVDLGAYFSSHPPPAERIEHIESLWRQ